MQVISRLDMSLGLGWYHQEHDKSGWFIWSSPRAHIDIHKKDYKTLVLIFNKNEHVKSNTLKVISQAGEKSYTLKNGQNEVLIDIQGVNTIALESDFFIPDKENTGSEDYRELSLQVYSFKLIDENGKESEVPMDTIKRTSKVSLYPKTKKRIISYSLWGNSPFYWSGAFKNIHLAKQWFPLWKCRFYVDRKCDANLVNLLASYDECVEVMLVDKEEAYSGMFWRFLAASDEDVDVFIVRDCDTRLSEEESKLIANWLSTNKRICTIRDGEHNLSSTKIMGGTWGARGHVLKDLKTWMEGWDQFDNYGNDELFLRTNVYKNFKHEIIEYNEKKEEDWDKEITNRKISSYCSSQRIPINEKINQYDDLTLK